MEYCLIGLDLFFIVIIVFGCCIIVVGVELGLLSLSSRRSQLSFVIIRKREVRLTVGLSLYGLIGYSAKSIS